MLSWRFARNDGLDLSFRSKSALTKMQHKTKQNQPPPPPKKKKQNKQTWKQQQNQQMTHVVI